MERKYAHVIVVGIDGAGAFIKNAETPNFDRIFANGAVTYEAYASRPSISAECWGSMLLGVGPEVHKLTNEIVSTTVYPVDAQFPSLFRRIKAIYPDAELGSYCDWNPITHGIVENNLGVSHETARDDALTPMICDYIRSKKPDFLFVQLDSVDGAGHKHGYGTPEHLHRISEVDVLMNDIHTAATQAGMIEDALFIVIADHGGTNPGNGQGGSHGGWTDGEKYVTFAAAGKGVCAGAVKEMNIRDLAAIVLYAFGIEMPAFDEQGWTAQIPEGVFEAETSAYRDISHLTGASPRISNVPHTSELI